MKYEDLLEYNWDDGLESIWPIIQGQKVEYAILLLIYWRLDGPYMNIESKRRFGGDYIKANAMVKDRILRNDYVVGDHVFDPELSKVEMYKLRKDGVPDILLGIQEKSDG